MSWMQRIAPTWMQSTQNTTQQHRRDQNSHEDRSAELQQRFPHHADQQPEATSSIQPPTSQDDHLRQSQSQSSHRITTSFQSDPFRHDAGITSNNSQRSCPEAAHSAATGHYPDHSNSCQRFCSEAAHSAASGHGDRSAIAIQPAAMEQPTKPLPKKRTLASLPVSAFRSFADNAVAMLPNTIRRPAPAEDPAQVHYDPSTHMVHRGHVFVSQSDYSRNPPSGTEHTAALSTNSTAASTAAEASQAQAATADSVPAADDRVDPAHASAFYRKSRFQRQPPSSVPLSPVRANSQPIAIEEILAPFDGTDIRKYPEFRDGFLSIIENTSHLQPRHKLQYLAQCLRGAPLQLVNAALLTSDEYYWDLIELLEERYGNEGRLLRQLAQDLEHLQPPDDEVGSLTYFYKKAAYTVRLLTYLGEDVDDIQLYHRILMNRVPTSLRFKLIQSYGCRGKKSVTSALEGLRQYISDLTEADESGFKNAVVLDEGSDARHPECVVEAHEVSTSDSDESSSEESLQPTANAAVAVEDVRLKERQTCPLCGLLHLAANCFMYLTIQKRLRRVLKLKICLLCLREGHPASMCPRRTKRSCKTCGHGQHHRILCKDADDSSRRKLLRPSQVRAPSRSSRDPRSSTPKRHSRKMSVRRDVTSRVTTAPKMCQPGTQRRLGHRSGNPRNNRKQRTWNHGADSQGRAGTSRPTTSATERVKQKTAKANGDGRLLPARTGHLQTEPHSTANESAKLMEQREAEEDSSSESSGGSSDTSQTQPEEPRNSTMLHHLDGVCCASSTDEPTLVEEPDNSGYAVSASATADTRAVLMECARATAVHPRTGIARDVIVFFDSGSDRSFATTTLLHDLDLPPHGTRSLRISTFGSKLPTTVEGVSTSIVLQSKHRRLPSLAFIARDCIVPSVRTALVEQSDLPMLRRNEYRPTLTIMTPDILIGQDLVSHFQRQYGPPLPSGFHVIHSILGPMIGGSGKVANIAHAAVTTVRAASAADVFIQRPPEADTTLTMTPSLQRTTCRSHLPTHLVVECTDIEPQSASAHTVEADTKSRFHPAHQAFSRTIEKHKVSGSKASTPECEVRHNLLDCTAGKRPPRKCPNPLDNTAPLPPLISTSHVLLPSAPPSSGPITINVCCANPTFPGDHVPDVVLVAVTADAESATQAHGSRLPEVPASIAGQQLRNPTHTVGLRTEQPLHQAPDSIEVWNTHEVAQLTAIRESWHTLLTRPDPCNNHDCQFAQLLHDLTAILDAIEPSIRSDSAPASAINTSSTGRPAEPHTGAAGSTDPTAPHSGGEGDRTTKPATRRSSSGICPVPADEFFRSTERTHANVRDTHSTSHRSAAVHSPAQQSSIRPSSSGNVLTFVNSSLRRVHHGTTGSMNVTNENVSIAIPMARRPSVDSGPLYSTAVGSMAHAATRPTQEAPAETAVRSRPARTVNPEHQRRPSSEPLSVGADGQPLHASTAPWLDPSKPSLGSQRVPSVGGDAVATSTGSSQHSLEQDRHAQLHSQDRRQQCTARQAATETPANNHTVGQPSIGLPDLASNIRDCRESREHPSIDGPSTRPHLATGRAPRADHADQGNAHHSSMNDATNLATGAHAVQTTPSSSCQVADFDATPCGRRKANCAYCGRSHFSGRCHIYRTVEQRLQRLRQRDCCLLCLRPGHWSKVCPIRAEASCSHCASRYAHHISLCRVYLSRRPGRSPAEQGPRSRNAPAAHQEPAPTAAAQRNSAKTKVRAAPPATHSVARGANSTGLSTTVSTFPPVLNHFCRRDESSPTTYSKARDDSHSVKNRSAAVPSPAQAPSRQPSRTGRKGTVAASSGRTRLEQQRREPDAAERTRAATYTARDAIPIKPNRQDRATHGEKTEHSSRDAMNHHHSKDLHQEPVAETSAEPTQHAEIRCELCTLHHRAERCTSFSSIEKRRQRAQYLWLCFACLAQDHRTEGCPNVGTYTCPRCSDGSHHQALCVASSRQVTDQADASSTPVVVPAEAHQRPLTPHSAVPDEDHQEEPTKAEHRRKPRKRKNRKLQK